MQHWGQYILSELLFAAHTVHFKAIIRQDKPFSSWWIPSFIWEASILMFFKINKRFYNNVIFLICQICITSVTSITICLRNPRGQLKLFLLFVSRDLSAWKAVTLIAARHQRRREETRERKRGCSEKITADQDWAGREELSLKCQMEKGE